MTILEADEILGKNPMYCAMLNHLIETTPGIADDNEKKEYVEGFMQKLPDDLLQIVILLCDEVITEREINKILGKENDAD